MDKTVMKQIALLQKKIKNDVAEIYACFAKCLYERGWNGDDIEELFMDTQKTWSENVDRMGDMIKWCEDTTGISVQKL